MEFKNWIIKEEEKQKSIFFGSWMNDGTIIVYISGQRYVYEVDPVHLTDLKKMAKYKPWAALNQIKKMNLKVTENVENPTGVVRMWHGSKRWDGLPEIRAPKKGRYEAGVGIYLTSSYERARSYAKGGGSTMLITLKPNIRYAYNVFIKVDTIVQFLNRLSKTDKKLQLIRNDIVANAERMKSDSVRAQILINLFVNYEAGLGKNGLELADFLQKNGVDANLENQSGGEKWIVVINPDIIAKIGKVSAKDVKPEDYNFNNTY